MAITSSQPSISYTVEERGRRFRAAFLQTTSVSILFAALLAIAMTLALGGSQHTLFAAVVAVVVCGASFVLTREGRLVPAAVALTYGVSAIATYAAFTGTAGPELVLGAFMLMIPVLGFVASPGAALPLGAV